MQQEWEQFRVTVPAQKIFEYIECEKNVRLLKERLDNYRIMVTELSEKLREDFEEYVTIFLNIGNVNGVNQDFVASRSRLMHTHVENDVNNRDRLLGLRYILILLFDFL